MAIASEDLLKDVTQYHHYRVCYEPVVECGGVYSVKPRDKSKKSTVVKATDSWGRPVKGVTYDTVICSVGTSYTKPQFITSLPNLQNGVTKSGFEMCFAFGTLGSQRSQPKHVSDPVSKGFGALLLFCQFCRYKHGCANVARTLIFAPTVQQKAAYDVLLAARDAALTALVPGRLAKDVYAAVVASQPQ